MTEAVQDRPVVYKPHPGPQTIFHTRTEDFVLFGGSKFPGKTEALLFESTRQVDKAGYKGLLIRRTFKRLQEIMDRAAEKFPKLGAKWEGEEKRWRFATGATIGFGHCEHENDKANYQGQQYAFLGFDQLEEFTESQVRFIMAQNRTAEAAVRCYVRATANPGGDGHWWVKRKFIDSKKPLTTYTEEFGVYEGKKLTRSLAYVPATIYDNPTGLQANPQYLAFLKSLPDDERKAFLDGDWDAFNSGCVFDVKGMAAQEGLIREPTWTGILRDNGEFPEFVLDTSGRLSIWIQPEENRRYLIAADVAKGVEGGDYSVALVFDRRTGELVAKWYGRIEPLEFGRILFGLGLYYNTAKIAVEVWPGPGIATGAKLKEMGYPRLYARWEGDKRGHDDETGWVTDAQSRNEMIAYLMDFIRNKRLILRDQGVLDEFRNFIRHENGKIAARSGCHDDQVMAAAIAAHVMTSDPVGEMAGENIPEDRAIIQQRLMRLPRPAKSPIPGFERVGHV